jgi:predicted amidophosphoribosyltransferase
MGLGAGLAMGQQLMNAMKPNAATEAGAVAVADAKFCVSCGKSIIRAAKFCPECGAQQQ